MCNFAKLSTRSVFERLFDMKVTLQRFAKLYSKRGLLTFLNVKTAGRDCSSHGASCDSYLQLRTLGLGMLPLAS